MHNSSVRPTDVLERIISTYGNMLFRYALIMLGSAEDAEDVIQDTLLKYWQKAPEFGTEQWWEQAMRRRQRNWR